MENRVNDMGLRRITLILALTVLIALSMQLATNAWIRISAGDGKISRFNKLFGFTLFKRDYDLQQFDRISLHHAYRGGYYASLVGREQEVIIARSTSLGSLRKVAEQAAAVTSLKINDQL